eukprot:jgi/Ulvmu1/8219/UM041_0028.1
MVATPDFWDCSCGEWPWCLRWSVCLHVDWSVASALLGPRSITVSHKSAHMQIPLRHATYQPWRAWLIIISLGRRSTAGRLPLAGRQDGRRGLTELFQLPCLGLARRTTGVQQRLSWVW